MIADNDKWDLAARAFADLCADAGTYMAGYWLERASERIWALCADRYMIPAVERIHAALVAQGITEHNKLDFNDLDDDLFYIPVEDVVRTYGFKMPDGEDAGTYTTTVKVFVHTTQNRDYLYVLNESHGHKDLHIRRIWRTFNPADESECEWFDFGGKSILELIAGADDLSEYSDYPRTDVYSRAWRCDRPSLEVYRKQGFLIPNVAEPFKQFNMYGDARDHGYILSFKQELCPEMNEFIKAEHVDSSEAALIMNCYLPAIEHALQEPE